LESLVKNIRMTDILKNRNILVTGGAGFVGSHLVEKLLAIDAKVFVFDWKLKQPGYFLSSGLAEECVCIEGDLRNFEQVKKAVNENSIDYIYHIAAQALVIEAFLDPLKTFGSNIMGTAHVLEAARKSEAVKGVFVASSDKAYGKDCVNVKEDQKVFGDHPYDASKAATDMLAQTYHKTYGLPVVVARFGNIFGPGDVNLSRIVPGIMEAVIRNRQLEIRSDGSFTRDYLYVKDVAEGYIKMAQKLDGIKGQAFNFSSGMNFSVIKLINKVSEVLGKKIDYKILNQEINEIPNQSLNFQKAKKLLGWQGNLDFDKAIKETFEWYKNHGPKE
jgi:CDP-glucose 4,6-dehydratase